MFFLFHDHHQATNVKDKELCGMEKKKKKKSFVKQSLDGVQRADQSIEREKSLELPGSAPQPTFVTTELRRASSQSTEGIGEALSTPTFSRRALSPESLGSTPHKGTFGSAMTGVAPSLPSFGSGGGPTPTSGFKSQIFGGPIPQSTAGSVMFGGAAPQSTAGSAMFGGAAPQSTAGSAMFGGAAPQSTAGSAMFGGAAPQSTAGSAMFGGAAPQSTAGSAMFGGAAPQSTAGSAMFGGAAPQSTAGSVMFGGAAPQSTAGSAMFGGAAPQSTAGSAMFGGAAPQSTAGSAMFGGAAPQSTAGSAMFGGAAPQSTAGSAMFGGAAPQSTAGSAMFGGVASQSAFGSAEGKTSMPTLGFGGAAFAPKSKSVAVEKQALNADTSMNSVSRDGFTMPLALAEAKPQTPQSGSPTASALSPKPLQRRSSRSVASSASLETVLGDAAIPPPLSPVRDRLARGKPPAPPSTLTGSAPPPPLSAPPLPPPPPPPPCLSPQLPQYNSKTKHLVKALNTRIVGNSSRPIEDMSIGSYLPTSPAYAPTSPAYALQSNQEQAEEGKLSKKAHRPISWRAISVKENLEDKFQEASESSGKITNIREGSSTTTYDQIYDCMGNVYGETESLIHETYDHEAAKVERSFQHSRSRSRDMSPLMKSSVRRREIARKEGKELNPLKRYSDSVYFLNELDCFRLTKFLSKSF